MKKMTIGILLVSSAIVVFIIDRSTKIISNFIGAMYCGELHLAPVENMVGDVSCGFNADMYLVVFLFVLFLIGVLLLISFKRRSL